MKYADLFSKTFVILLGVGVFAAIAIPAYESIAADGKADYCYVTTSVYQNPTSGNVVVYHLNQHVPWRSDRYIGYNLKTIGEAAQAAQTIGCHIK